MIKILHQVFLTKVFEEKEIDKCNVISVIISAGATFIGKFVFDDFVNFKGVIFEACSKLENIDYDVFEECGSLEIYLYGRTCNFVVTPRFVEKIAHKAFGNHQNFRLVIIEDGSQIKKNFT